MRSKEITRGPGSGFHRRGQALTEFTIMAVMMLSIVLMTLLFLGVFTEYGKRMLTLIGLDAP